MKSCITGSSSSSGSGSSSKYNMKENKYERFERWLLENHGQFSMLELRAYNDNVNNVKPKESHNGVNQTITEEKKEMQSSTRTNTNMNTNGHVQSSSLTSASQNKHNLPHNDPDDDQEQESEMRGVHARCDIPPNTICVSIPKKCLITVEMGQATDIGQIILKSDLDLDAPKHIFLMIFLLYDRKINGDNSFFKPYYDILPKTLHNIPIFWTDDELKYLEGSYLVTQIADRNEAITEDYYAICEVAPELAKIASLEEFKWARMCVCSRNFGLQIDGHRTSALVPHADMLNHHRPRETKWTYDDDLQAFTITTLQRIPCGSQVYDSYGQKCNHRFLLNYGFAVEDNREMDGFCPNEVPIELKVSPNDPLYDAKQAFWSRGEGDANGVLAGNHPANITAAVAAAVESARTQHLDPTLAIHSAMQAAVSAAAIDVRKAKRHGQSQWQPGNNGNARSSTSSPNMNSTLDTKKRIRICVSNNENTRVLFSMLRVLACNEEELCTISSSATLPFGDSGCSGFLNRALRGFTGGHISESNTTNMQNVALFRTARDIRHPLGLRNEKAAMECLLNIIKGHLDLYPCSLAQDMADLMDEDSHPRFSNRRHAKIQVRGEKEVLHHFAVWAQTAIDVIEIIEGEIKIANGETDMNTTTATNTTAMATNNSQLLTIPPQQGFEYITHMMEEEEGVGPNGLHHTIVRYCCDVLGALRKEALKDTKRGKEAAKLQESRKS